jgi:hypothetical protein
MGADGGVVVPQAEGEKLEGGEEKEGGGEEKKE